MAMLYLIYSHHFVHTEFYKNKTQAHERTAFTKTTKSISNLLKLRNYLN